MLGENSLIWKGIFKILRQDSQRDCGPSLYAYSFYDSHVEVCTPEKGLAEECNQFENVAGCAWRSLEGSHLMDGSELVWKPIHTFRVCFKTHAGCPVLPVQAQSVDRSRAFQKQGNYYPSIFLSLPWIWKMTIKASLGAFVQTSTWSVETDKETQNHS